MNKIHEEAYKVLEYAQKNQECNLHALSGYSINEYKRTGVLIYRSTNVKYDYYDLGSNYPVQVELSTLDPFLDENFFQMQLIYNDDEILMYCIFHLFKKNNIENCYCTVERALGEYDGV